MNFRSLSVWFLFALLLGCSNSTVEDGKNRENRQIVVAVSNYPLKYFVDRIAASHVDVVYPIPADIDPAFWQPDDSGIQEIQNADVLFINGAGYESWLQMATILKSKIVDTSASFRDQLIATTDGVVHQHGPEGEHSHQGTAFTTWLDPQLATRQAMAVRDWLATSMPENKKQFEDNFERLSDELNKIDDRLSALGLGEMPLLGSHPVYQYLAKRASLNLQSVHFEPDAMPDDDGWSELTKLLEKHPAKIMLWEDEPIEDIRRRLNQLGVEAVVFRPAGNTLDAGDWLAEMNHNIDRLERAAAALAQSDNK